jgi:hypothetical protein
MIKFITLLLLQMLIGCQSQSGNSEKKVDAKRLPNSDNSIYENFVKDIKPPVGYKRVAADQSSFTTWLRSVPLKKNKTVYLFNGKMKPNQLAQYAVIDISVGNKDLQQCADAVMRLRAEYLYSKKNYAAIAFMDYSGKWYKWSKEPNRAAFDNYLQTVFGWCGSASLEKQLKPVNDFNYIKAGDVLIQGGFPGHAIIVIDIAINENGKKIFMLAQGYQPAQDMHILINPMNSVINPWYELSESEQIITPEWQFMKKNLKSWE